MTLELGEVIYVLRRQIREMISELCLVELGYRRTRVSSTASTSGRGMQSRGMPRYDMKYTIPSNNVSVCPHLW